MDLHLANSGKTARNVEIDVKYKGRVEALYISSIGPDQRVPILMGNFPQEGGVVLVNVSFKDSYGTSHKEELSIDFEAVSKSKRRFTYVTSPLDAIASKIEDVERAIRH